MNKDVFDYILDLDKLDVDKDDQGLILLHDSDKIMDSDKHSIQVYDIDGVPVYVKDANKFSVFGMIMSRLYRDLGFTTPKTTLAKDEKQNKIKVLSQDVNNICEPVHHTAEKAGSIREMRAAKTKFCEKYSNNREFPSYWSSITEPGVRETFLEVMNEDCFDSINALRILGEIVTYNDFHQGNYFQHKRNHRRKSTGAIPIDLECTGIFTRENNDFKEFLRSKYHACDPFSYSIGQYRSYEERILSIIKLIQGGKLSQDQINLIKQVLSYDITKPIKEVGEKFELKPDTMDRSWYYNYWSDFNPALDKNYEHTSDYLKRIWEYLSKTLGREL